MNSTKQLSPMDPLQAKQWLISVARQRVALCKTAKSRKGMQSGIYAERILAYLEAFSYSKPGLLAAFIIRHRAEIEEILPGEGSKCHDKKKEEFNEILQHHERILQSSI